MHVKGFNFSKDNFIYAFKYDFCRSFHVFYAGTKFRDSVVLY